VFDKTVYNKLLKTYVDCVIHWEAHPISGSAKRETNIAKISLDTYITDCIKLVEYHYSSGDNLETIHNFFRD
jgi:hypothetical protein